MVTQTPLYSIDSNRYHSHEAAELREDLRLAFADLPVNQAIAEEIVASLKSYSDSQDVFHQTLLKLGDYAFGQIALFAIKNNTSLMGQAETMTRLDSLIGLEADFHQFHWDSEDVNPSFVAEFDARVARRELRKSTQKDASAAVSKLRPGASISEVEEFLSTITIMDREGNPTPELKAILALANM